MEHSWSRPVRRGRHVRFLAAIAALGAGALGALGALEPPSARAAAPPRGLIVTLNGRPTDAPANLPGSYDVDNDPYRVCCPNAGGSVTQRFSLGWSLSTLIQAAGASPELTGMMTIDGDGKHVVLQRSDVNPGTFGGIDFLDQPAFIYTSGTGSNEVTDFFRPIRALPPADANANDWIQNPPGGTLRIDVATGVTVHVGARATTTVAKVGQPVTFTADALTPIPGERLSYLWGFTDGTLEHGPSVAHAFAGAGTYQVDLNVAGDHGSGGAAPPLEIVVRGGSGAPGHGDGSAGPPTNGGLTGPATGGNGEGTGSGAYSGVGAPGSDGSGSGASTSSDNPTRARDAVRAANVAPPRAAPVPSIRGNTARVRGVLLAGYDIAGVAVRAVPVNVGTRSRRATGPSGAKLPSVPRPYAEFVVAALALALFAAGAAGETLGMPARRRRRGRTAS